MTNEINFDNNRVPTMRSVVLGVVLFAAGMLVWALGHPVYDDNVVGAWALFLLGGGIATNGLILACGSSLRQRGSWWLAVLLGLVLYLIGIASPGELSPVLAVSAGVVVLVAGFARTVLQFVPVQR